MTDPVSSRSVAVRFINGSLDQQEATLELTEGFNGEPGESFPPSRHTVGTEVYRRYPKDGSVWPYKLMHQETKTEPLAEPLS